MLALDVRHMALRFIAAGVISLFFALQTFPCYPQGDKKLDERAASKLLVRKIKADALYSSWAKMECLRVMIEKRTSTYFDFVIRERHRGRCPGDPNVEPVVDRFRVYRSTKKILWYEPINGE